MITRDRRGLALVIGFAAVVLFAVGVVLQHEFAKITHNSAAELILTRFVPIDDG